VHDITDFEGRGTPSVFVASSAFIDAADAQARSLGFPSAERVFVPHPIQDRTDDEMRKLADAAIEDVIRAVTARAAT
jgi:hypothetical protein